MPINDEASVAATRARAVVADQFTGSSSAQGALKRLLRPLSRALTVRLVLAVEALADGVEGLSGARRSDLAQADRTHEDLRRSIGELEDRLGELRVLRHQDATDLRRLRLATVAVPAVAVGPADPDGPRPAAQGHEEPLDPAAYLEFERRFRGSREVIQERQHDAVRYVEELAGGSAPLLDLGAGRGEWLAVLAEAGIPAYGVDANGEMAAAATDAGLDVRTGDALVHLDEVEPGTLGAVSAFHLVEHVPVPVLRRLLDSALLALQPGGVLVLETPNPTNLVVGAAAFYLDPSHIRPLHPMFLQFLVEIHGFTDAQVHLVHPVDPALAASTSGPDAPRTERILDAAAYAIFGPQDYVVVARRPVEA